MQDRSPCRTIRRLCLDLVMQRLFRGLSFPFICVGLPSEESPCHSFAACGFLHSAVLWRATTRANLQAFRLRFHLRESRRFSSKYYLSSSSRRQVFCGQFVACSLPEHFSAHLARQACHLKDRHSNVEGQLRWLLGGCQTAPAIAKLTFVCHIKPLPFSHGTQETAVRHVCFGYRMI